MVAENFWSGALQHEIDHLNGKLWIDHVKNTKDIYFADEFMEYGTGSQEFVKEGNYWYLDEPNDNNSNKPEATAKTSTTATTTSSTPTPPKPAQSNVKRRK